MRWFVFGILAYLFMAVQVSGVIDLPAGGFGAFGRPFVVLILAVFVGLSAPPRAAMIAWGTLGLLLDLTTVWPLAGSGGVTIIGPYALGCLAAGYTLLELRGMLFRQHPLTLGAMVVLCGVAMHLVVVGLFTIRQWYDPLDDWIAKEQLLTRGAGLAYTAALAVVLAWPLLKLAPALGFQASKSAVPWGRRR